MLCRELQLNTTIQYHAQSIQNVKQVSLAKNKGDAALAEALQPLQFANLWVVLQVGPPANILMAYS